MIRVQVEKFSNKIGSHVFTLENWIPATIFAAPKNLKGKLYPLAHIQIETIQRIALCIQNKKNDSYTLFLFFRFYSGFCF